MSKFYCGSYSIFFFSFCICFFLPRSTGPDDEDTKLRQVPMCTAHRREVKHSGFHCHHQGDVSSVFASHGRNRGCPIGSQSFKHTEFNVIV